MQWGPQCHVWIHRYDLRLHYFTDLKHGKDFEFLECVSAQIRHLFIICQAHIVFTLIVQRHITTDSPIFTILMYR